MPDKQPHQDQHKKPSKSIKEQRAEKRAKRDVALNADPVAHLRKPRTNR